MNAHKAVGALRMLNVARRTAQSVQSYVHLPPQLYAAAHAQQCLRCFSQGGGNPQQAEMIHKMLDLMATSPQLQEMMMSALPKFMRRPEVIKSMLASPDARSQIANMMIKQGMSIPPQLLASLERELQAGTFQQLKHSGMDPAAMFSRFAAYPGLLAAMSKPHVMAAISDISSNPASLAKYQGQRDIMDVYTKVQEILQAEGAAAAGAAGTPAASPASPQPAELAGPQQAGPIALGDGSGTSAPPPAAPGSSAAAAGEPDPQAVAASGSVPQMEQYVQSQLGLSPQALMSGLMQRPQLAAKIQSPRVQAALAEISASPWKAAKYVLDSEVMGALKELRELLKQSKGPGS